MEMWSIVGYLAAVFGSISLLPEVIKAYRTHHLRDVSWGMIFFLFASSVLWGSYGLHVGDFPLVISATVNLVLESALTVMKKHYSMTKKPLREHLADKKLKPALETETIEAGKETN